MVCGTLTAAVVLVLLDCVRQVEVLVKGELPIVLLREAPKPEEACPPAAVEQERMIRQAEQLVVQERRLVRPEVQLQERPGEQRVEHPEPLLLLQEAAQEV